MKISKTATSKAEVPVRVSYKCSMCGFVNNDRRGTLTIVGRSSGGGYANDSTLKTRAYNSAVSQFNKIQSAILLGNYQGEGLRCSCENCGKEEPWSMQNSGTSSVIVFVIATIVWLSSVIWALRNVDAEKGLGIFFGGLLALLIIMIIFSRLRVHWYKRLIKTLQPENMPKVYFK